MLADLMGIFLVLSSKIKQRKLILRESRTITSNFFNVLLGNDPIKKTFKQSMPLNCLTVLAEIQNEHSDIKTDTCNHSNNIRSSHTWLTIVRTGNIHKATNCFYIYIICSTCSIRSIGSITFNANFCQRKLTALHSILLLQNILCLDEV